MALPDTQQRSEVFRRFGLGWQFLPPEAPVVMTFLGVTDRRGEVRAEVLVEHRGGGHLLRRYINLLGSNTFRDLARDLSAADGGAGFPWPRILESAFESVIRAVRTGPELHTVAGRLDRPPGVRWLCQDLVMANVPNVWIAAGSTGKSTFASGLAVHHTVGEPFLGRDVERGVPLFLDWESTDDDFEEKVWLWSRWLGLAETPPIHRLRMRGPATSHAAALGNRIDALGATLVIWDGVQAAGGPLGQHATYETLAQELEQLIGLLPETTHLLLDHVTGDELKDGAVPMKGRGSTRKYEFTRNQWTMILDREARRAGQHVVGWTHTKINRGKLADAFGVELLHRPDELGYRLLGEAEVAPLAERMPQWQQLLEVLRERPLTVRDAALAWKGAEDDKTLGLVRALVSRHGRYLKRYSDGMIGASSWESAGREPKHPHLRAIKDATDEPPPLPF